MFYTVGYGAGCASPAGPVRMGSSDGAGASAGCWFESTTARAARPNLIDHLHEM